MLQQQLQKASRDQDRLRAAGLVFTCWVRGGALHKLVQLQQLHELGVRALVDLQLLHQRRLRQHALQLRRHILALLLGCLHITNH